MKISNRIQISAPFDDHGSLGRFCITGFHPIFPRFRSSQKTLLAWLTEAHRQAGYKGSESIETLFSRYGASADHIAYRRHDLTDFSHQRHKEMRLFGPAGSDISQKTNFFEERVNSLFERFYPKDAAAPDTIVHVTCTGYSSPSGAQRLVSLRKWGSVTQVIHAYHMGCYAAHPAIRIAAGLASSAPKPDFSVDVVHTELCSLHLDPSNHDPAQLVIQSLFADGYIKYQLTRSKTARERQEASLEILAARDEIISDSTDAMRWVTGPLAFAMILSKDVPILFASALPRFAASLFEEAGLDWAAEKPDAVFAIHPGGPRIVELSQRILKLDPPQLVWSRSILREHGNMSSTTLPHIWQKILEDPAVPNGTLIISIGAGPGLTLSGMLFRKQIKI